MSERFDLADAACPARFQPNFLRAAKPKAKTALAAGLKTRDAPIRADSARQDERSEVENAHTLTMRYIDRCSVYTTAYSGRATSSVTVLPEYFEYRTTPLMAWKRKLFRF